MLLYQLQQADLIRLLEVTPVQRCDRVLLLPLLPDRWLHLALLLQCGENRLLLPLLRLFYLRQR
jgi:hypothetical protein